MNFFWIVLKNRGEKSLTLKKVIESLSIWPEEKDLYLLSLDILSDHDFSIFFDRLMSQIRHPIDIQKYNKEYSIEPLTSQII